MSTFSDNVWFEVEHCYKCSMAFAMPSDFKRNKLKDRSTFYCPSGHPQYYIGQTEEQRLKKELEQKAKLLEAANDRVDVVKRERDHITKAHVKMRSRVMNGVCPCCNRTFQNLMSHMKSEHPEFRDIKTVAALRAAFGMTQADVAREAGVHAVHVSLYERDKPVSRYIKNRLEAWADRHNAAA